MYTAEVGEADSVSSVSASACHRSGPKGVTPQYIKHPTFGFWYNTFLWFHQSNYNLFDLQFRFWRCQRFWRRGWQQWRRNGRSARTGVPRRLKLKLLKINSYVRRESERWIFEKRSSTFCSTVCLKVWWISIFKRLLRWFAMRQFRPQMMRSAFCTEFLYWNKCDDMLIWDLIAITTNYTRGGLETWGSDRLFMTPSLYQANTLQSYYEVSIFYP